MAFIFLRFLAEAMSRGHRHRIHTRSLETSNFMMSSKSPDLSLSIGKTTCLSENSSVWNQIKKEQNISSWIYSRLNKLKNNNNNNNNKCNNNFKVTLKVICFHWFVRQSSNFEDPDTELKVNNGNFKSKIRKITK